MDKILVTGGAGFIGSFLVDALLERGNTVRVYDALVPQVHGPEQAVPAYLNPAAELVRGDMRDRAALAEAIEGMDVIYHLAAAVGVGQSMYQIQYYTEANTLGGAVLLDLLANTKHGARKVIVASSMSIYGEGKYECADCGAVYPRLRTEAQLKAREWEMKCPHCGRDVQPVPTDEEKPLYPTSIYASPSATTKRCSCAPVWPTASRRWLCAFSTPTARARHCPILTPASWPSSRGGCSTTSRRYLRGRPAEPRFHPRPRHCAGLTAGHGQAGADNQVFNLGTGRQTSVGQVAEMLSQRLTGGEVRPDLRQPVPGRGYPPLLRRPGQGPPAAGL